MTIVAAILLVAMVGLLVLAFNGRSAGLADAEREALERERDEARADREEMRKRLEVLERIATDPARRTADEIEKLRDE